MTEKDLRWIIDFKKDLEGNIVVPAKVVEELLEEVEYLSISDILDNDGCVYVPRYCTEYTANLIRKRRHGGV